MNLSAVHYLVLALGGLVTIAQFIAGTFPQYAALAHAIAGLAGSLAATLGVLSPSAGVQNQIPSTTVAQDVANLTQQADAALNPTHPPVGG